MRRLAVVVCLLATAWVSPVAGQDVGVQRQQLEQRVRRAFQTRVRQDLQLTAAEVPQLTEVIRWSEGLRRGIAQRTRELNARAVDFLRDGGAEAEAVTILEDRKALQREEADLFAQEQIRLLEVLSPNQVVRYYRLRDQFNRQLQQARARRPGNGRGNP